MQRLPSNETVPRYCTFVGLPFQSTHVYQLRRHHGIPSRYAR
jgi:hypothetical protein